MESKLAVERNARERAEFQIDDLRHSNPKPSPVESTSNSHLPELYEKKIHNLQNELEQVRNRLKRSEEQVQSSPLLLKQLR